MDRIESLKSNEPKWPRVRKLLGRILPSVDPVIDRYGVMDNSGAFWNERRVRQSGRTTDHPPAYVVGALIVPTAEFIDPYTDLSDEDKERMVAQFEIPPAASSIEG